MESARWNLLDGICSMGATRWNNLLDGEISWTKICSMGKSTQQRNMLDKVCLMGKSARWNLLDRICTMESLQRNLRNGIRSMESVHGIYSMEPLQWNQLEGSHAVEGSAR